jgi:hypothetical protein
MTDFMLRTNTEAQMDDALEAAGILVEQDMGEGEIALVPVTGVTLDRIGPIPGKYDPATDATTPGDPRYHANIRCMVELTPAQVDALPTFMPEPTVPYRVFI